MRWPRLVPRRRDAHTAVITGVKSAVRAGDTEAIRRILRHQSSPLGLPRHATNTLTTLLAERVLNTANHEEVSSGFRAVAEALDFDQLPSQTWFTLENLSRTVGCFEASAVFTGKGLTALKMGGSSEEQFLAALHQRDLNGAEVAWNERPESSSHFWRDASHYLWLWSGGELGAPQWSDDPTWISTVSSHQVTILGPAPTSLNSSSVATTSLVARVIMQDVLRWDEASDPLNGRCELAYASRETRNWLRDQDKWSELSHFQAVSFRVDATSQSWQELGVGNLRSAHNPKRLMIGGSSPNMIPLMVWDLLKVPDVSLVVGGTTFFASQTAYTQTNRRFKHTLGKATDETGSTGELFERCPTFARHNVTENLALVANLVQAGALKADDDCRRVIDLPVSAYLAELDQLYGIDRR